MWNSNLIPGLVDFGASSSISSPSSKVAPALFSYSLYLVSPFLAFFFDLFVSPLFFFAPPFFTQTDPTRISDPRFSIDSVVAPFDIKYLGFVIMMGVPLPSSKHGEIRNVQGTASDIEYRKCGNILPEAHRRLQ